MKSIEAFEVFDGTIFEDEDKALSYVDDKLGESLDSLLKLFAFDGNQVTHVDEYKSLLQLLKRKKELRAALKESLNILQSLPESEFKS